MADKANKAKIGIVGYGYVGKAMYKFFEGHYPVVFYDPYVEGGCTKEEINECDLAVVCVFTPTAPNGACDTSIVEEVINWIETPLILIKSTVALGTTEKLKAKTKKHIVFSPEYIGESTYDTGKYDFNKSVLKHSFYTFGGDPEDTKKIVDLCAVIGGPNRNYLQTDATSAEIAKYMENAFYSTKLVFCYEFDQICKQYGADYNVVRELWLQDPRINSSHTSVFWNKKTPFDGKCLPKDLKAIIQSSEEAGYQPEFLKEVLKSNDRITELRK